MLLFRRLDRTFTILTLTTTLQTRYVLISHSNKCVIETQTKTVLKNKKVDKFKEDSQLFYLNSCHWNQVIASTIISQQRTEKWKKKIVARVPCSMSSRACRHFVCACMYTCVRRMTYERSWRWQASATGGHSYTLVSHIAPHTPLSFSHFARHYHIY